MPKTANESMLDEELRYASDQERWRAGFGRRAAKASAEEVGEAARKVAASQAKKISAARRPSTRASRQRDMERAVKKAMGKSAPAVLDKMKTEMASLAKVESAAHADQLRRALRGTGLKVNMPTGRDLRGLATGTSFHGGTIAQWTRNAIDAARRDVVQAINAGAELGESPEQIAARTKAALQKMERNFASIAKTAAAHVSAVAREMLHAANPHLFKGIEYVAVLDSRTTAVCAALDGKVFPFNKGPRPPMHFNCRSTTLPVLKSWRSLGVDGKKLTDADKARLDGRPAERKTYGEWLRGQPASVQDDALGKVRARLFRSGKLTIRGMVDQNHRPLTLVELQKRRKLRASEVRP